jgi:hypothetical protein
MNTETLQFAMYLTGDGEEDIEQMYYDWINSPSTPSFAPQHTPLFKDLIYEQDLPDNISSAEYAKWFNASHIIDGVRMGYPLQPQPAPFAHTGLNGTPIDLPHNKQPFAESWKQHLQQQIDELRKWKESAIQERKGRDELMYEMSLALLQCKNSLQELHDRALPNINLDISDLYNLAMNPIEWIEQIRIKYNKLHQ